MFLVGCSSTPTRYTEIDRIHFIGDGEPRVTSKEAFKGNLDKLAPNESLVIAKAKDGSGALSQPSPASIIVVEPKLKGDKNNNQYNLWLKRCDVDSDGILDRHCPELFSSMNRGGELSSSMNKEGNISYSKFVSMGSWYTINSNPKVDKDFWGSSQTLNTANSKTKTMPVTLKLLSINLGNKAFMGDLDIIINIPPRVELGEISLASKVASRKSAKEALEVGLLLLNLAGASVLSVESVGDTFFDDYAPIKSEANFDITNSTQDQVFIKVSNIELKPEQGVTVEFNSLYEIID